MVVSGMSRGHVEEGLTRLTRDHTSLRATRHHQNHHSRRLDLAWRARQQRWANKHDVAHAGQPCHRRWRSSRDQRRDRPAGQAADRKRQRRCRRERPPGRRPGGGRTSVHEETPIEEIREGGSVRAGFERLNKWIHGRGSGPGDDAVEVEENIGGHGAVSFTHLRAHENLLDLVCPLLL